MASIIASSNPIGSLCKILFQWITSSDENAWSIHTNKIGVFLSDNSTLYITTQFWTWSKLVMIQSHQLTQNSYSLEVY